MWLDGAHKVESSHPAEGRVGRSEVQTFSGKSTSGRTHWCGSAASVPELSGESGGHQQLPCRQGRPGAASQVPRVCRCVGQPRRGASHDREARVLGWFLRPPPPAPPPPPPRPREPGQRSSQRCHRFGAGTWFLLS